MDPLIIEYVLGTRRPGYTYTSPTGGYDENTLKTIWQQAMPRGQGWRRYIGARSLKCFALDNGRRAALVDVTVTDQTDEGGRQGIRRAVITVIDGAEYLPALQTRLAELPESVNQAAMQRLTCWRWKRILDRAAPKLRTQNRQIVLTAPYTDPTSWQVMEATLLHIAVSRKLRAVEGWPPVFPLTTLVLDPREETRLVALPLAKAKRQPGVKAITLAL